MFYRNDITGTLVFCLYYIHIWIISQLCRHFVFHAVSQDHHKQGSPQAFIIYKLKILETINILLTPRARYERGGLYLNPWMVGCMITLNSQKVVSEKYLGSIM